MKKKFFSKKKYFTTAVCLAVGIVLLTGSALANFENASGYSKVKKGALSLRSAENLTAQMDYEILLNGNRVDSAEVYQQFDNDGAVSSYNKEAYGDYSSETWIQDGYKISHLPTLEEYSYSLAKADSKGFNGGYVNASDEEKAVQDKTINFFELLCDTLVGDLKNNVVLESSDAGNSTYSISLSKEQVPELVNAGLSMLSGSFSSDIHHFFEDDASPDEAAYEQADKLINEHGYKGCVYFRTDGSVEYYESAADYYAVVGYKDVSTSTAFSMFADGPELNGLSATATIDSQGRITRASGEVEFTGTDANGGAVSLTMKINAAITDYGTTVIEPFDISVLNFGWTEEDLEHIKNYDSVYFDADGNRVEPYYYDEDYMRDTVAVGEDGTVQVETVIG